MIPFFDAKNYILRDPYSLMAGIRDQGSGIRKIKRYTKILKGL